MDLVARIIEAFWQRTDGHGVLGLCGAQGSGKSTIARRLCRAIEDRGRSCVILSLDDLYLTRGERERLARTVHPLLLTRGPPGTHDVELGIRLLNRLGLRRAVKIPRFDKARDDRFPRSAWDLVQAPVDVILFEGWCVGAIPQGARALVWPINALEASEDTDGRWRRFVNEALAGDYQRLFGRIDMLVLLAAPGFEVVPAWRHEQEDALRVGEGRGGTHLLGPGEVERFTRFYERLTRHILATMPERADIVVRLDERRTVLAIEEPRTGGPRQGGAGR
jgi:D-glycerate 3-kinase